MARSKKAKNKAGRNKPVGSLTRAAIRSNSRLVAGYGDLLHEKKKKSGYTPKQAEPEVEVVAGPDKKVAVKVGRLLRKALTDFERDENDRGFNQVGEALAIAQEADSNSVAILTAMSDKYQAHEFSFGLLGRPSNNLMKKVLKAKHWRNIPVLRLAGLYLLLLAGKTQQALDEVAGFDLTEEEAVFAEAFENQPADNKGRFYEHLTSCAEMGETGVAKASFTYRHFFAYLQDVATQHGLSSIELVSFLVHKSVNMPAKFQFAVLNFCRGQEGLSVEQRASLDRAIEALIPELDSSDPEDFKDAVTLGFYGNITEPNFEALKMAAVVLSTPMPGMLSISGEQFVKWLESDYFNAKTDAEKMGLFEAYLRTFREPVNFNTKVDIYLAAFEGLRKLRELSDEEVKKYLTLKIEHGIDDQDYKSQVAVVRELSKEFESQRSWLECRIAKLSLKHYESSKSISSLIVGMQHIQAAIKAEPESDEAIELVRSNLWEFHSKIPTKNLELVETLRSVADKAVKAATILYQYYRAISVNFEESNRFRDMAIEQSTTVEDLKRIGVNVGHAGDMDGGKAVLEKMDSVIESEDEKAAIKVDYLSGLFQSSADVPNEMLNEACEIAKTSDKDPFLTLFASAARRKDTDQAVTLAEKILDTRMATDLFSIDEGSIVLQIMASERDEVADKLSAKVIEVYSGLASYGTYFKQLVQLVNSDNPGDRQQAYFMNQMCQMMLERAKKDLESKDEESADGTEAEEVQEEANNE